MIKYDVLYCDTLKIQQEYIRMYNLFQKNANV